MSGIVAKRVLLAALTVCLALLVFSFARHSVEVEMYRESRLPRQNPSLTLEYDGKEGVIRIGGEGKLYGTDMEAMLEEHGIPSKAARHIIIGDGITEIGYDALKSRRHLITLKLGKGVRRIAPGGLKSCVRLCYIYLPSGLESVGGDCLYDCNNCRVITDGDSKALPKMAHLTKKNEVLEHIDSYEALAEACGDESQLPSVIREWWP